MADAEEQHQKHVDVNYVEEKEKKGLRVGPGLSTRKAKLLEPHSRASSHDATTNLNWTQVKSHEAWLDLTI